MGYHEDPIVNDIVLTIINDGNGSQCGMDYEERKRMAESVYRFRTACREYNRQRSRSGSVRATPGQIIQAADILQAYYREHVAECSSI